MKLVYEDEYGAYSGVRAAFLKKFMAREINPNFEVFDSLDGNNRIIAVKSSRIPDDEDLAAGKFGIDFNRNKPTLTEALEYEAALPRGYKWLGDIAFASIVREEYDKKSAVWDSFYSYVWGLAPQNVWVAPHSGSVDIPPDDIRAFPKLMIDNFTAGVAALCAFKSKHRASKRLMMAVHGTGQLGAVLNLGDFGILDGEKLNLIANKMEVKYHDRVQVLADEFKQDFCLKTIRVLENIQYTRGTLAPGELSRISRDNGTTVELYIKCLKFYGQEIKEFAFSEFKKALRNLGTLEVPVISVNYLYPGKECG